MLEVLTFLIAAGVGDDLEKEEDEGEENDKI